MITLEKIKDIEKVLGVELLSEEVEAIKEGWNAFYMDPEKYAGTVVVDMIKLDLNM